MKKNKLAILLCLFACVFALFSCDNSNNTPTIGGVDEIVEGTNPDKVFRIISNWEKSGIGCHYNAGTSIGPLEYFTVEGLYQYVRSTDEIVPILAESMPEHSQDGLTTTIKIRQNAKWQNGEDFVAKDVWAFYYLNHTTLTNYLLSVEVRDEKTVVLHWNPNRVPVNEVKDLLIAQDVQGTACYQEFRQYADTAYEIVSASDDIAADSTTWGAFNKFSKGELLIRLNENYSAYRAHKTSWFVATGAYYLDVESPTQVILKKNPLHWNAENISIETIIAYSTTDTNQIYAMLANNQIDYLDGLAPIDTLESILAQNTEMAHLKMYDPGSIGVLFNLEKTDLWTYKVREAFQYIFNREQIKNAANPYAITSYYPLLGMAASEAKMWMTEEGYNNIPTFSHDTAKAEALLKEAGWTKVSGKWHDQNGNPVKLTIGTVREHPGMATIAQVVQAELEAFGIDSVLKMTDHGAWYYASTMDDSTYDMSVFWTDLNMSFSYPTGSYSYFNSLMGDVCHVNRYPDNYEIPELAGQINFEFDAAGSKFADKNGKVNFSTYVNNMYVYGGDDIRELVDIYNLGMANQLWGIQMYQNVTGSFINISRIKGVPGQSMWMESRNVTTVPSPGTEDFYQVAKTNLIYARGIIVSQGIYQANS